MSTLKINSYSDLIALTDIIYNINIDNIDASVSSLCEFYDYSRTYSFNLIICRFIYTLFVAKLKDIDIIIKFLNSIERNINKNQINILDKSNIFDIFSRLLLNIDTQEANYLLYNMIEHNLIEPKIVQNKRNLYFIHYMPKELINNNKFESKYINKTKGNYDELSKNDWELHKQLIKEGVNPNEIAKILRNDEIEKLQEISSQNDFDFNQTIEPSLYERYSFINQRNVTLIDYAAFFSSVKCFKYLLLNGANVKNTGQYAVAGGNEEIIHLCEQNHSSFFKAYETAIEFHRNNIFKYLCENKLKEINNLEVLGVKCILFDNYETFSFLLQEGMQINDNIIITTANVGNIFLVEYFLKEHSIPHDIFVFSSGSGNNELVEYFLKQEGIDINAKDI